MHFELLLVVAAATAAAATMRSEVIEPSRHRSDEATSSYCSELQSANCDKVKSRNVGL